MNLSEKLAAADGVAPAEDAGSEQPKRRITDRTPSGETPRRRSTDRSSSSEVWSQSKAKVQAKVLSEIAPRAADLSPDELRTQVRSTVNEILEREDIGISPIERQRFVEEILEDSLGYGPLEVLLADETITEVMCNSFDEVWIERKGQLSRTDTVFSSNHQYRRIIDRM